MLAISLYLAFGGGLPILNANGTTQFREQTRLNNHTLTASVVRWSPQGNRLASGGLDEQIVITEVDTRAIATIPADSSVYSLEWSPLGDKIAYGDEDHIKIISTTDWSELITFTIDPAFLGMGNMALDWSPDGKILAAGAVRTIKLWDTDSGAEIYSFRLVEGGAMGNLLWSPSGNYLALTSLLGGGMVNELIVIDLFQLTPISIDMGVRGDIAWSPNEDKLAYIHWEGLKFFDPSTFTIDDGYPILNGRALIWSPNSQYFAAYSADDNAVLLLDSTGQTLLQSLPLFEDDFVYSLDFSPDTTFLAAATKSGDTVIYSQ